MKALIIEDEELIANSIARGLKLHRFYVDTAYDGKTGYELAVEYEYDIILLDLMLPDMDGEELCRKLRHEKNNTYIIMLTAKRQTEDIVNGLNLGADDYITKPFDFSELIARIRALFRRNQDTKTNWLSYSDLKIDLDEGKVTIGSEEIVFSKKEFVMLEYLIRNKGIILTRNQILEHAWDRNVNIFTNVVDSHIKNIRKKLGDYGILIETVYGLGYRAKKI